MIYFIRCAATGTVKIGHAADPWKRLYELQCGSPNPLELLAVEEGAAARERELHRQFAVAWRRGEWFDFTASIRAYVAELPEPIKPSQRKALGGALGDWLHKNELSLRDFGKMVGCSAATLSQACAGNVIPRKPVMQRIYVVTRGEVRPDHFYDLPAITEQAVAA